LGKFHHDNLATLLIRQPTLPLPLQTRSIVPCFGGLKVKGLKLEKSFFDKSQISNKSNGVHQHCSIWSQS